MLLAETFAKVHSNKNISEEIKRYRDQKLTENPQILEKKVPSGCKLDAEFTLFELKKSLLGVKQP